MSAEQHRRADTQDSSGLLLARTQGRFAGVEFAQRANAALVKLLPIFGQNLGTRRTVEQPRVQASLQAGYRLGNGRSGQSQTARCLGEASRLDDMHKDVDPNQAVTHCSR